MASRKQHAGPPTAAGAQSPIRRLLTGHPALIAIVAAAVAIRLWNVGWGLPHLYEEAIPLRFGMKLWPSLPPAADNHFFVYPGLTYYLQLALQFLHFCAGYATGAYRDLAAFIALFEADPTSFTIVARCATILFDAGIVIGCYALVDRRFGRTAALLAAAFISVNVLHVRESHLVNVDTPLAFFSVAALWALDRLLESPSTRRYLLAGAAIGLAAASKYNGGILAAALLAAHVMAGGSFRESVRPRGLRRLSAAGATAAAVFLACNPLIVTHFGEFLEKFRSTESHMEAGHLGLDPGKGTAAFYLLDSLPDLLGVPLLAAALLSAAWLSTRKDKRDALLLIVPLLFALMLAHWNMRADRYILPVVPFLLMIAAAGIAKLPETVAARLAAGTGRPAAAFLRERGAYAAALLGIVVIIPSLRSTLAYQRLAGLPDTRTVALEWITANIKPASAIATGPFGIELPATRYITLPIQFSAVNSERMTPFYNPGWYRDIDLLVVSDFDYGRYRLEPGRFREILGYLDTIRSGWELVRSFEQGDSMSGPAIRLYRYPGEITDDPYPDAIVDQLLSSGLEPERTVAFLGKLGLIQSMEGRLARAEQLFRIVLRIAPGNETAQRSLREILAYRSPAGGSADHPGAGTAPAETGAAAGAARAAVEALVSRGDSLLAGGDLDEAERSYRSALSRDGRQVNAYLGLTLVYAARDDRAGVVRTLRDLLKILPPGSDDYARVAMQLRSIEGGDVK